MDLREQLPKYIIIAKKSFIKEWLDENDKRDMAASVIIDNNRRSEYEYKKDIKNIRKLLKEAPTYCIYIILFQDSVPTIYDFSHNGRKYKTEEEIGKAKKIRETIYKEVYDQHREYYKQSYYGKQANGQRMIMSKTRYNSNQTEYNLVDCTYNSEIMRKLKKECVDQEVDIRTTEHVNFNPYEYPTRVLNEVLEELYGYYQKILDKKPINQTGFTSMWCNKIMEETVVFIPNPLLETKGFTECPEKAECVNCIQNMKKYHILKQATECKNYYDNIAVRFLHSHPMVRKPFSFTDYYKNLEVESIPAEFMNTHEKPKESYKAILVEMETSEKENKYVVNTFSWEDHRLISKAAENNQEMLNHTFIKQITEEIPYATKRKTEVMLEMLKDQFNLINEESQPAPAYAPAPGTITPEMVEAMISRQLLAFKEREDQERREREKERRYQQERHDAHFIRSTLQNYEFSYEISRLNKIANQTEETASKITSVYNDMSKNKQQINYQVIGTWLKEGNFKNLSQGEKEFVRNAIGEGEPSREYEIDLEYYKKLYKEQFEEMKRHDRACKQFMSEYKETEEFMGKVNEARYEIMKQKVMEKEMEKEYGLNVEDSSDEEENMENVRGYIEKTKNSTPKNVEQDQASEPSKDGDQDPIPGPSTRNDSEITVVDSETPVVPRKRKFDNQKEDTQTKRLKTHNNQRNVPE